MWLEGQKVAKLLLTRLITGTVVEVDRTCYAPGHSPENPWVRLINRGWFANKH